MLYITMTMPASKSNHILSCSGFNINFSGCLQPTLVTRHNNSFHRLKTKSRVCDLCWMKAFLGNANWESQLGYTCTRKIIWFISLWIWISTWLLQFWFYFINFFIIYSLQLGYTCTSYLHEGSLAMICLAGMVVWKR